MSELSPPLRRRFQRALTIFLWREEKAFDKNARGKHQGAERERERGTWTRPS